MTMYRKTIVIGIAVALAVISLLVFVPAKLADNKEQEAARALEAMYGETFAVTKSNALQNLFSDTFELSVQSQKSSIVYDFTVRDDEILGDYYTEQLHAQVAQLLEGSVDGLVLAKTDVEGLTELVNLQEAEISNVSLMLLTNNELTPDKVQNIVDALRKTLGPVAVVVDVLVVDDEEAFTGVTYEIEHFFQKSTITKDSFDGLTYSEQTYSFDVTF